MQSAIYLVYHPVVPTHGILRLHWFLRIIILLFTSYEVALTVAVKDARIFKRKGYFCGVILVYYFSSRCIITADALIVYKTLLLYRYWWNTRISPFTKKIITSLCAVKILYLSHVKILVSSWLLKWLANKSFKSEFMFFNLEISSVSIK